MILALPGFLSARYRLPQTRRADCAQRSSRFGGRNITWRIDLGKLTGRATCAAPARPLVEAEGVPHERGAPVPPASRIVKDSQALRVDERRKAVRPAGPDRPSRADADALGARGSAGKHSRGNARFACLQGRKLAGTRSRRRPPVICLPAARAACRTSNALHKALILHGNPIGEWCNGSTTDSDSVCLGSNPGSPAT